MFLAPTPKGNLAARDLATKRGEKLKPGAINDRVQVLAERAGTPYIAGKKVTAHSLAGRAEHRPGASERTAGRA